MTAEKIALFKEDIVPMKERHVSEMVMISIASI